MRRLFASRVFFYAGMYGLLAVAPMYFLEARFGVDNPPAITHPEFFYGFVGVALACQVLFLILSQDPARYRPMMIPAVLEKLTFGVAVLILLAGGRVSGPIVGFALIDLLLGALFAWSYVKNSAGEMNSGKRSLKRPTH
ncbi:MAG TPA: hypothetical protein VGJ26_11925 [Pirellulales bacterium]|jgi:hypothetical protein